jgi:dTDP-4-dehydrorhamnose reductase
MDWDGRRLLVTGATGTLGNAFARICDVRALPFCLTDRDELDICDEDSIEAALDAKQPWAVINTAGFVRVADAERERGACFAWNADGPERLARACATRGIPLVTFSSDLVFGGRLGRPYVEDDEVSPIGTYGESKAEAERRVLAAHDGALVVRTSAFFGPWDRYNFAWAVVSALAAGETFTASSRNRVSPTYVPDLCHAALDLLIDGETGIWHLANQGAASWHDFACRIAEAAGFDSALVVADERGPGSATILSSHRGMHLRSLDEAIADYAREIAGFIEAREQIAAE